jgi:hypothetical protein
MANCARIFPELISVPFRNPLLAFSCSFFAGSGRPSRTVPAMPLFFFRIKNGRYSGCSDQGTECADRNAAWKELTSVCADMASGISRKLAENSEWQMEMLDEKKQPVFRIRIVAESFD